jgi:hypothetical protein
MPLSVFQPSPYASHKLITASMIWLRLMRARCQSFDKLNDLSPVCRVRDLRECTHQRKRVDDSARVRLILSDHHVLMRAKRGTVHHNEKARKIIPGFLLSPASLISGERRSSY